MQRIDGQHVGNLHLEGDAFVSGQVAGSVTVGPGANVIVGGQITGDLIAGAGARVTVRGMVRGRLLGAGECLIAEGAFIDGRVVLPGGTWGPPAASFTVDERSPVYDVNELNSTDR